MFKRIAIIVPVYRESLNLIHLYERLEAVVSSLPQYSWKYIFVNDGSPDNSLEVLHSLSLRDPKVLVLDLSRNFGKEIALTAGVHEAEEADAVICMDADLQHPPEPIPSLIHEWEKGVDVVATIRTSIEKQPLLRRFGSDMYYWLMSKISGLDMVSQTTDYRLYDKKVVTAFRHATERERMFRGIMDWMGFRRVYVEFKADARNDGKAGYSYVKLRQLALNSITSFSLLPLRLTGYLGILVCSLTGLLLFYMLITDYFNFQVCTPLAYFVVFNTLLVGVVLSGLGMLALYIGHIHTEVVGRPLYIIQKRVGNNHSPRKNKPSLPDAD